MLTAVTQSSDIVQSYLEDGNFHHIMVTVSGAQVDFYLDGNNTGARYYIVINANTLYTLFLLMYISRTLNGSILDMSDSEFVIGGDSFVGAMQDVRFYSSVLSIK